MQASREEIQSAIERSEEARAAAELTRRERSEGRHRLGTIGPSDRHYELLGAITVALLGAELTLLANFLVFVWIFHVQF